MASDFGTLVEAGTKVAHGTEVWATLVEGGIADSSTSLVWAGTKVAHGTDSAGISLRGSREEPLVGMGEAGTKVDAGTMGVPGSKVDQGTADSPPPLVEAGPKVAHGTVAADVSWRRWIGEAFATVARNRGRVSSQRMIADGGCL